MAHVALNFNSFLEKTKLKDDGSNYTDWVRNLRIILIAAKKDYVRPPTQHAGVQWAMGQEPCAIGFTPAC